MKFGLADFGILVGQQPAVFCADIRRRHFPSIILFYMNHVCKFKQIYNFSHSESTDYYISCARQQLCCYGKFLSFVMTTQCTWFKKSKNETLNVMHKLCALIAVRMLLKRRVFDTDSCCRHSILMRSKT